MGVLFAVVSAALDGKPNGPELGLSGVAVSSLPAGLGLKLNPLKAGFDAGVCADSAGFENTEVDGVGAEGVEGAGLCGVSAGFEPKLKMFELDGCGEAACSAGFEPKLNGFDCVVFACAGLWLSAGF